jgi:hypothetical protein
LLFWSNFYHFHPYHVSKTQRVIIYYLILRCHKFQHFTWEFRNYNSYSFLV